MSEIKQGLQITMDWETVDDVMEKNLIDSYRSLCLSISQLSKQKKLPDYAKEDLEHDKKVLAALDIVGEYYVYNFKKKVKKK